MQAALASMSAGLGAEFGSLNDVVAENEKLRAELAYKKEPSASILNIRSSHEACRAQAEKAELEVEALRSSLQLLADSLAQKNATIALLREQLREQEEDRKALHNQLQDLRGNIRVLVRIRPVLADEMARAAQRSCLFPSPDDFRRLEADKSACNGSAALQGLAVDALLANANAASVTRASKASAASSSSSSDMTSFYYDRVFGAETSQETLFREISGLVQSVLDGYRVCMLAYGQTGSGKTFSMEGEFDSRDLAAPTSPRRDRSSAYMCTGPESLLRDAGIVPRAFAQLFSSLATLNRDGAREIGGGEWQYEVTLQMVEIYNETIRDLLTPLAESPTNDIVPPDDIIWPEASAHQAGCDVRADSRNGSVLHGAVTMRITSAGQALRVLRAARRHRATTWTRMNASSSRSHLVSDVKVFCRHTDGSRTPVNGSVMFVDLAGSERLSRSGAEGIHMRETGFINKSLSTLGDVLTALATRRQGQHIPFRNSKLTFLLQPCLSVGAGAKVCMLVNASPLEEDFPETLCSLRFASKVSTVVIGPATTSPPAPAVRSNPRASPYRQSRPSSAPRGGGRNRSSSAPHSHA
eukprot:NODE_644_length_1884_cov_8.964033_g516_i0.p1 GENE.NODE_644_length_1884_cov_8.964033_g516_i0~~NODE_644_length_1884_cov_8.964033_g516_i0.p1  ORF type:complete len:603 (+),score=130.82 NODE_644_length_1884_cov_8.964033_g516_i0:58-1809(+)